jgi:hypothetical protein
LQFRHLNQTALSSQSFPQAETTENEQSQQVAKSSKKQYRTWGRGTTKRGRLSNNNISKSGRKEGPTKPTGTATTIQ